VIRTLPLLILLGGACDNGVRIARLSVAPLAFRLLTPSDDGAANDARARFRWTPFPGADRYRVSIYSDAGRRRLVEFIDIEGALEARAGLPLVDGAVYYAQVEVLGGLDRTIAATGLSRFRVRVVPDWMPRFELRADTKRRSRRDYLLVPLIRVMAPPGEGRIPLIAVVNDAGEVVWWYREEGVATIGVAEVTPEGTLLYVRAETSAAGEVSMVGNEITWQGDPVWKSRPGVLVHHEITEGPMGLRMYMTHTFETWNGEVYEGDGIELIDKATNTVLWEWNIFDHFRPEEFDVPEDDFPGLSRLGKDWSHANGILWDEARGLIWMSIRHFDRIIGIDFPSGDIRITLGQGGLGGPDLMRHQHAPELQADGSLLLWDNGNFRAPERSRILQVRFDEILGTATEVFTWRATPDLYDFALGDVDRLPSGNILATAGVSGRLIEVNPLGEVVWEIALATPGFWIYRTEVLADGEFPGIFRP